MAKTTPCTFPFRGRIWVLLICCFEKKEFGCNLSYMAEYDLVAQREKVQIVCCGATVRHLHKWKGMVEPIGDECFTPSTRTLGKINHCPRPATLYDRVAILGQRTNDMVAAG